MEQNPLGLNGIDFVEFSSASPETLHKLFLDFGFSKIAKHPSKNIDLYRQGGITFLLNYDPASFGYGFQKAHGPSISAMGWRFKNAESAFHEAVKRGAKPCVSGDYRRPDGSSVPAIYGIGDSLIYFIDTDFIDTDTK
ncbi:MAG: 4-hydroxyphenylpyruvate dioxygenase, partial [Bdellovibrionaceae bacterium]|nr:4-hydroxyphenylpyruvate dioxygenase [Pseudobdellovibrionaceae bacterium]